MHQTFEAFYFLIYASFLGLGINLFANMIHDHFSDYKYYFVIVSTSIIAGLYLLIRFVDEKWKEMLMNDETIRAMSDGVEPKDLKKIEIIFEKIEILKNELLEKDNINK